MRSISGDVNAIIHVLCFSQYKQNESHVIHLYFEMQCCKSRIPMMVNLEVHSRSHALIKQLTLDLNTACHSHIHLLKVATRCVTLLCNDLKIAEL